MKLLTKVAGAEIVASGSNSNGEWIKFGNGTMIQWGTYDTGSKAFTTPYGSAFFDGINHTIFFPISFISNPTVQLTPFFDGGIGGISVGTVANTSKVSVYLHHLKTYTFNTNALIYWTAIGKWK